MHFFSSIRTKLIFIFALIVILSLVTLGGLVGLRVYEQTKSDYMFSVEQQLSLIDMGIEHYMSNIANNTQMLATLPLIKAVEEGITSYVNLTGENGLVPMIPEEGSPYEREVYGILDSFQNSHISVLNASLGAEENGGFIKSPPAPRFDYYDARQRQWYQSALANKGQVFFSDLYTTSSDEFVVYSVMTVENEHGEIKGVISLDIDLSDLSDMIGEIKLGSFGYVVLIDSKETILAHPKKQELVGKNISALSLNNMPSSAEEFYNPFVETLERPYWVKRTPSNVPYFDIEYIVFIEESAFFTAAYRLIGELVIITFFIMIFAVIMAYVFSNRLTRPIRKLQEITESFSVGNLSKRAKVYSKDEVGLLATTFNTLADRIQTAKSDLEDQVKLRTLELEETVTTLKDTQEQLIQSEKLAGLGTLVSGVAHEINTPLGIAITSISHLNDAEKTLKSKFSNGTMKKSDLEFFMKLNEESIQIALKNLDRAKILVHNFKQVSADQAIESKRLFNVKTYTETILQSLMPKLKKHQHKIELSCDESLSIFSYPGAYGQVLTNLLLNSMTHGFTSNNSGMINLSIRKIEQSIELIYQDNGVGMSHETLKKIFEPFFTTKRDQGGTGLGLHIVYNIITLQLHGTILCESSPNQGTTFIIRFPAEIH